MYVLISVLIVIAALFLVFVVVIQNSKGGGLAAGFSSSNQVMGVRKTTDFLEKATWSLAGIVAILCIASTIFLPRHSAGGIPESEIKEDIENAVPVNPNATPFGNTPAEGTAPASSKPEASTPATSTPATPQTTPESGSTTPTK